MSGKAKNGRPDGAGTPEGNGKPDWTGRVSLAEQQGRAVLVGADAGRLPLPAGSIQAIITSPPYWEQRAYEGEQRRHWPLVTYRPMVGLTPLHIRPWCGALGQEPTPAMFIGHLVTVCRELRRVLREDGTFWLNVADTYRAKQLLGIPWRLALALQADGWTLRSDPQWIKTNGIPKTAPDRPGLAHEYLFQLTKSTRYYYDPEAVRAKPAGYYRKGGTATYTAGGAANHGVGSKSLHQMAPGGRHRRTSDFYFESLDATIRELEAVRADGGLLLGADGQPLALDVPTVAFSGSHFAPFPPDLVTPLIKASCPPGGIVLDPFAGTGTVIAEAVALGRLGIGADLFPGYLEEHARSRLGRLPVPREEAGLEELPLFGGDYEA